jgi:hypothetical protein
MTTDVKVFAKSLKKELDDKNKNLIEDTTRKALYFLYEDAVMRSPVDTGRFINSFRFSEGSPNTAYQGKLPSELGEQNSGLKDLKINGSIPQIFYMTNAAVNYSKKWSNGFPYFELIETEGWGHIGGRGAYHVFLLSSLATAANIKGIKVAVGGNETLGGGI